MKNKTLELFEVNSDVLALLGVLTEIGWSEVRESSIHRILYLSSVLYAFMLIENENDVYENYHFSLSPTGPYSEIINRSLINLKSRGVVIEDDYGGLGLDLSENPELSSSESNKLSWFKVIVYILGLYGENKIFGFVIQDPQYRDDFQRNSQTEIDISDQNKTVKTLNQFKVAFEETLNDVSEIDHREYLELYFEYVFSKIIKRE